MKRTHKFLCLLFMLGLLWGLAPTNIAQAATIGVNTTDDELNSDGDCSLREAIRAANTNTAVDACPAGSTGDDIINIPAGIYTLTLTGISEDAAATGDLDIIDANGSLTINGESPATTIIDGNATDRVFDIRSGVTATINNLTVRNGYITATVSGSDEDGGGIAVTEANVILNNLIITNNFAGDHSRPDGAGVYFEANSGIVRTLQINNSTIYNNTTDDRGGGIYTIGAQNTLIVRNSTISGNQAVDDGGGLAVTGSSSSTTIVNSTIVNNVVTDAGNQGGGIDEGSGTAVIQNTIIANNTAPISPDCWTDDPETFNYSLIEDATNCNFSGASGNNVTGSDPNLAVLTDNGGPTPTHALQSPSPAIDVVPTAACENGGLTSIDQRGAVRNIDGNGSSSVNECDIGAFEYDSPQAPTELRLVGNCNGADLSGNQAFPFTGGTVNLDVTNANGLKCISVGRFASDHPNATGSPGNPGLATGQWWRINGNIDSGFTVNVTLPFAGANADSRACKWLDGAGTGAGWDCGTNTDNTEAAGVSVTRDNYTGGFSDWAVGDEVGPTAVSNLHTQTTPPATTSLLPLLLTTLLATLTSAYLWVRRPRRSTF